MATSQSRTAGQDQVSELRAPHVFTPDDQIRFPDAPENVNRPRPFITKRFAAKQRSRRAESKG
jgi:hypothetical protein